MVAGLTITAVEIFHVGTKDVSGTSSCSSTTTAPYFNTSTNVPYYYTITCDGSSGYFSGMEVGQAIFRGSKKYIITTYTNSNTIVVADYPIRTWSHIVRGTDGVGTYLESPGLVGLASGTMIYILGANWYDPIAVYHLTASPTTSKVYSTDYHLEYGYDITLGTKYDWSHITTAHATWSGQTLKKDYEPYTLSQDTFKIYGCSIAQKLNSVDHTSSLTGILTGSGFTDTSGNSVTISANDLIRIWVNYTSTSGYSQEQIYFIGIVKEVKKETRKVTIVMRPLNSILSEQTFPSMEETTHNSDASGACSNNILPYASVPLYGTISHGIGFTKLSSFTEAAYPTIRFSGQTLWDAVRLVYAGSNQTTSSYNPGKQVAIWTGPATSLAGVQKVSSNKINGQTNVVNLFIDRFSGYLTDDTTLSKTHFLKPVVWSENADDLVINACRCTYRSINYSYEDQTSQDRNGYRAASINANCFDYLDGGTPDMATPTYMEYLPKNIVSAYSSPYERCTVVAPWNYVCNVDNSGNSGIVPVLNHRFSVNDSHNGGSGKTVNWMTCIGYVLDVMSGVVVLDLSTRLPYANVISELDSRITNLESDLDMETGSVVRISDDAYQFNGPLYPATDEGFDIGASTQKWNDVYCNRVLLDNTADCALSATSSGQLTITTNYGNVSIGPANVNYSHFNSTLPFAFNNHVILYNTNLYDIGSSSYAVRSLYLGTGAYMGGTQFMDSSRNLSNIGTIYSSSHYPDADGTRDLGSGTYRWNDLFANGALYGPTLVQPTIRTVSLTASCSDSTSPYTITCATSPYFTGIRVGDVVSVNSCTYTVTTVTLDGTGQATSIDATLTTGSHSTFTNQTLTYQPWDSLFGLNQPTGAAVYMRCRTGGASQAAGIMFSGYDADHFFLRAYGSSFHIRHNTHMDGQIASETPAGTAETILSLSEDGRLALAGSDAAISIAGSELADVSKNLSCGSITASGNVIPSGASTLDLGSTTAEWANLYVGTGKIYFGATQASNLYDSSGTLKTDDNFQAASYAIGTTSVIDSSQNVFSQYLTMIGATASATTQFSNDTEVTTSQGTYTKIKTITVNTFLRSFRVYFEGKYVSGTNGCAFKIYRNGTAVGTERTTSSTTYVNWSEDFTNLYPGETIQLYAYRTTDGTAYAQNFRIQFTKTSNPTAVYTTSNP